MAERELTENEKAWIEDCKKCHGNLKKPLLGVVLTPYCAICKNAEFYYGTQKEPECMVNAEQFEECMRCDNYECPQFDWDEKAKSNYAFDENHRPLYTMD